MTKKYADVQFDNAPFSKLYQFLTDIEDLKSGDKVVVDTKNGLTIATVDSIGDNPNPGIKAFKWVVQKVDLSAHEARIERERQLAALTRKMQARKQELQEIQIFALLAKEDDAMRQMLEEFKSLSN